MTGRSRGRLDAALVVGGVTISVFGSSLTTIAVLLATSRHGAAAVAAALICQVLPVVAGAPLTGRLADRCSNRLLLSAGLALQLVAVGCLAFALEDFATVCLLLFVLGSGSALTSPAAAALVPAIGGEAGATRLYSRMAMGRTIGSLGGWALGGLLVETLGGRSALLIDSVTYAVYAGAVLLLSVDRRPGARTDEKKAHAFGGFATLREIPTLGLATIALTLMIVFTVVADVAEVFFVTGTLGQGGTWLGIITSCWMLGAFAGSWLAGRFSTERQLLALLGAGGAAVAAGLSFAGIVATVPATVVGYLLAGAGNGTQSVCQSALVRVLVPEERRGRVFAAVGALLQGGNIAGLAGGGLVVGALGPRASFIVAGAVTAAPSAAVLIAAARAPRASAAPPP